MTWESNSISSSLRKHSKNYNFLEENHWHSLPGSAHCSNLFLKICISMYFSKMTTLIVFTFLKKGWLDTCYRGTVTICTLSCKKAFILVCLVLLLVLLWKASSTLTLTIGLQSETASKGPSQFNANPTASTLPSQLTISICLSTSSTKSILRFSKIVWPIYGRPMR